MAVDTWSYPRFSESETETVWPGVPYLSVA